MRRYGVIQRGRAAGNLLARFMATVKQIALNQRVAEMEWPSLKVPPLPCHRSAWF